MCFSIWLNQGCYSERQATGERENLPKVTAVYFLYAGAESDKPFFPIALIGDNASRQAVLKWISYRSRMTPTVFLMIGADLDSLIASIKDAVDRAPIATNADFGDFEVNIIYSSVNRKVISRRVVLELLQQINPKVLQNNPLLSAQLGDLRSRLSHVVERQP